MNVRKIAAIAGCSKTTVSDALAGNAKVAARTRERIHAIARDLGYRRHGPAAMLATGRTQLLGVVLGTADPVHVSDWEVPILNGLARAVSVRGLDLVLLGEAAADGLPKGIAERRVDAAAFMTLPHPALLERVAAQAVPCVLINVNVDGSGVVDSVWPDDAGGVRAAVAYLAGLGHRRVAYVNTYASIHEPSVAARFSGYRRAVAEFGLASCAGGEQGEAVESRLRQLLTAGEPPTAVLCYNDYIALAAIQTLTEHGQRVPQDVNVVGIDDLDAVTRWGLPGLTSVHVPYTEMGFAAGELLLERLENANRAAVHREIPERLVVRATTAAANVETPAGVPAAEERGR